VHEISRETMNGFTPNSHGRHVWSLARKGGNVKVKGQRSRSPGTKTGILALSATCVRFMFGKTSLASSFKFCRFTALAYTTLDRLLAVFFSMIFAVLSRLKNTSTIGNL